ncbi:hypothetical protein QO010_003594 [Caulobacter ginsengisoli]|uniref:Uncharacterized protein n=1 Tax=Caulobacter ginsengisoli TaxID=400775 RepID=A0ABU0IUV6_9CAUL|nr:hypothetical protein [Caulobacter ginsengisoli]MDQ0465802.1 hypothetical protein [Caulobacter ginsengisoli]
MKKTIIGLSLGLIAVTASPALANNVLTQTASTIFSQCDGYGMPASGGDGMTSYANIWGIFNPPGYGTTAKADTNRGTAGIAACDAALADEHLLPAYWRRKVNLLQARALHRLEKGDAKGALADLDLADAAIADRADPFFARSQGISLGLVRAYAQGLNGDQAGSEALAMRLLSQRPYSRQAPFSALIAIGEDGDPKLLEILDRATARLQPSSIDGLYKRMIGEGRWAEAIPLYGQLAAPKTRQRFAYGGTVLEYDTVDILNTNLFWIDRGGSYAYALATQGRGAEARAALAAVRARFEAALVRDPPLLAEKKPKKSQIAAAASKVRQQDALAVRGAAQLNSWTSLVERRVKIDEGGAGAVVDTLVKEPPPRNVIGREFMTALAVRLKADPKTLPETLQVVAAATPPPTPPIPAVIKSRRGGVASLFETLPTAETAEHLPNYKKAGSGIWTGDESGFTDVKVAPALTSEYGPDVATVKFRSMQTNPAVAEEMALLRAADLALQAGKSGLIILARADVEHTLNSTYYGSVVRSDPTGFSTELSVVFVDKANLPERFKGAEWRVIDARAAYDALAPIYVRPETEKPKKKR